MFFSCQHPPTDAIAEQQQDEMAFINVGAQVKVMSSSTSDILSSESETAFTVCDKEIQRNLPPRTTQTVDALRDQLQAMKFVVLLYYNNCDCEVFSFSKSKNLKFEPEF